MAAKFDLIVVGGGRFCASHRPRCMHLFLNQYQSPLGIKVSQTNLQFEDSVICIPLYALEALQPLIANAVAEIT